MSTTDLPPPPHPSTSDPALYQVLQYHHQTKHSFSNYARGPSNLDWASQPNPFRRYPPSPLLPLLHPTAPTSPLYPSLFSSPPLPPAPLTHSSISQLFYDSLSLSAWKSTGFSTWSLRVNPSSGNLHPTESYLVSPPIPPLSSSPFVAHYAPKHHSLELRAPLPPGSLARLGCPDGSFLLCLSSVFWRESWKYGERALRYCNHDAGHAVAAVAFAAAALGWDVRLLDGLGYRDVAGLMGLVVRDHGVAEPEHEHADCVLLVFPNSASPFSVDYPAMSSAIAELSSSVDWVGKPNSLSKDHVYWDIIYRTAEAAKKPLTADEPFSIAPFRSVPTISSSCYENLTVREVVRKRRSAVDMDGVRVMERETFYHVLLHCLPMAFPFRVVAWDAQVHFALFVHRVRELPKGLYFLVRNGEHLERLRGAMRSGFEWEKPEGCPGELPLYRLAKGDCQRLAKQLSCHQVLLGFVLLNLW